MKKYSGGFTKRKTAPGFTLIELLVVIAVLGVLATAIVAVINPLEKIAKAKDSTRKAQVSALANALQSYYTLKNGAYPTPSNTWITDLVTNGDLKNVPPPAGGTACTTNNQNGYCYKTNSDQTEVIVYTGLESSERPSGTSETTPYSLWSSATGESGTYYSVTLEVPDAVVTSGFVSGPASTLTQGLAGWWKMNNNADDSSGNGNNGAVINGAGSNGTAYTFSADSSQRISIDTPSALDFGTGNFSISAWFKTNYTGYGVIVNKKGDCGSTPAGYGIAINGGQIRVLLADSSGCNDGNTHWINEPEGQEPIRGSGLNNNVWHHVAVIFDRAGSKTIKVYVGGAQQGSAINSAYLTGSSGNGNPLWIGTRSIDQWSYFDGSMDDVRIYNRALSASEVSNLFSAGPQ